MTFTKRLALGFGLSLCLFPLAACSDDGSAAGDGDGDSSTGGSVEGSGGEAGDGDASAGGHCSPGETYDGVDAYFVALENCDDGRSIELDSPLGPGDTYAFSVDMGDGYDAEMHLWGATEECGAPLELLATAHADAGVVCMEVSPVSGTYTHLMWVWDPGIGGHRDVTFCPAGSCGE